MFSAGLCFWGWELERDGCSRLGGGVSHARLSGEVGKYICSVCVVFVVFFIWQDGFKLRDYLKAESDICLLGDKIAKKNTFLPAP